MAIELKNWVSNDQNFMKSIIMGDEMRVYEYDPETKVQSWQWKNVNLPYAKICRSVQFSLSWVCTYISESKSSSL